MFESKNIYVLNKKDANAIVYEDADGNIIRLTREHFSSENEFLRFKAWSDEEYHNAEKERHIYADNILSLEWLSEEAVAITSVEDAYLAQISEQERKAVCCLLMDGFNYCLTDVQRRRLWLYVVDGMTLEEIATVENVTHQSVSESILKARKKIQDYFEKHPAKTPLSPR